ncbi:MAG: NADH-quinone oxidoreductase subunit L [Chloroflexales bacterium]|nr:NADH-quinone oxidoreductase subunit L [Chloroflexales bacterium]
MNGEWQKLLLDYILLIPLLPFLGFLANAFIIRNERTAGIVASGAVLASFVVTLVSFVALATLPVEARRVDFVIWNWISVGALNVPFGLLFDPLSGVMLLLVTGVGALIHIYSIGYMRGDARVPRYFAYLNLFITMMTILVMGDNLLLLFLGWEGVGLCSFLLIGFWFERRGIGQAAVKAFIANRIGDAALLLAMMSLFKNLGTLTFYSQGQAENAVPGMLDRISQLSGVPFNFPGQPMLLATAIGLLILLGVAGKSAQVPLFVWLPDAMVGPTPVSALIHAATMVTSGVYLLARMHGLFALTSAAQSWVVWIGTLTAIIAATAAIAQWDIKRVLAYSTISQLGYMVAACGMGIYGAAIFHLLTHGIFKALLFLGSGSVIHGTHDTQDMRRMGGLRQAMPTTFWTYAVGALSLAGIFPLAGFWSKDEIVGNALFGTNPITGGGYVPVFLLLFATSLITAFYMGRQVALVFYGAQRDKNYKAHESPRIMTVPLIILAIGTVLAGVINLPVLEWLGHWLEPVTQEAPGEYGAGEIAFAVFSTVAAMGVAYVAWRSYTNAAGRIRVGGKDPFYRYGGDIWDGFEAGWGFDWLYQRAVVQPYRAVARFFSRVFDPLGIDGLVNGVGRALGEAGGAINRSQSGLIRNYALLFLIGVVAMIAYFVLVR